MEIFTLIMEKNTDFIWWFQNNFVTLHYNSKQVKQLNNLEHGRKYHFSYLCQSEL
jgi:hypothetical protein